MMRGMDATLQKLLTQQEVDALPSGTRVSIKWAGGNGPHEYELTNVNGQAFTTVPRIIGSHVPPRAGAAHHRVDFVGSERCQTQVSVLADDTELE
jgi:hypothetical protein